VVDAGMRQLRHEGWLPNRARLVAASFLTRTLRLDWRVGADAFSGLLVDADLANNVGNWQWVAGTGTDPRPNRLLNPTTQGHRFDPHGAYVRRWVPELAGLSGRAVHEPWRARRSLLAPEYPTRVVDHEAVAALLRAERRSAAGEA
jgi:deoxyribodipyrimidine photo-lyase